MSQQENDPSCIVPNGRLVIIGGAESKEGTVEDNPKPLSADSSVLAAFVEICEKKHPHIEVITTAGTKEDAQETFNSYRNTFKKLGAQDVGHIHHNSRSEIEEEQMQERIRKADGVFMSGGDQLRLTSIYGGTSFLTHLKEAYLSNKLTVGGTSAGAMALSTPMIFAGTGEQEMIAGSVKITTGLEFLKDVCIDTHFVHRGRFVRMAQVIATNPASIGIEEDTAIVVTEGLKAKVIGSGVVIIIDGVKSQSSNIVDFEEREGKKITVRDLNVSILSCDETFEIPQRNPPHQ